MQVDTLPVYGKHLGRQFTTEDQRQTLPEVGTGRCKEYTSAVMVQGEGHVGMGQRVVRNQFVHLLHFTGDGF